MTTATNFANDLEKKYRSNRQNSWLFFYGAASVLLITSITIFLLYLSQRPEIQIPQSTLSHYDSSLTNNKQDLRNFIDTLLIVYKGIMIVVFLYAIFKVLSSFVNEPPTNKIEIRNFLIQLSLGTISFFIFYFASHFLLEKFFYSYLDLKTDQEKFISLVESSSFEEVSIELQREGLLNQIGSRYLLAQISIKEKHPLEQQYYIDAIEDGIKSRETDDLYPYELSYPAQKIFYNFEVAAYGHPQSPTLIHYETDQKETMSNVRKIIFKLFTLSIIFFIVGLFLSNKAKKQLNELEKYRY